MIDENAYDESVGTSARHDDDAPVAETYGMATKTKAAIAVGIVAVLAAGGIGAYFATSSEDEPQTNSTATVQDNNSKNNAMEPQDGQKDEQVKDTPAPEAGGKATVSDELRHDMESPNDAPAGEIVATDNDAFLSQIEPETARRGLTGAVEDSDTVAEFGKTIDTNGFKMAVLNPRIDAGKFIVDVIVANNSDRDVTFSPIMLVGKNGAEPVLADIASPIENGTLKPHARLEGSVVYPIDKQIPLSYIESGSNIVNTWR